jgi:hypothetical protein
MDRGAAGRRAHHDQRARVGDGTPRVASPSRTTGPASARAPRTDLSTVHDDEGDWHGVGLAVARRSSSATAAIRLEDAPAGTHARRRAALRLGTDLNGRRPDVV